MASEFSPNDELATRLANAEAALRAVQAERDQLAASLAEANNFLTSILDLSDKIYFKDLQSRFITVSRGTSEWAGLPSPSAMIGKTDFDIFAREHAEEARADERQVLSTGVPIISKEEKETWPDGRVTWVSTTKMPLRDPQGNLIGTFGISRDITERKCAELKLEETAAELQRRNAELEQDLAMARELQQALLPATAPRFPLYDSGQTGALRFSHCYMPSGMVSGDFFHIVPISNSCVGIFICDVMGHGVRAALVAALLRALVEETRLHRTQPGTFLEEVNNALCGILRHTQTLMFATAFYAVIDIAKGEVTYSNAAHPQPLWVQHRNGERRTVLLNAIKPGPALGLFPGAHYDDLTTTLGAGDMILLFTDGLFEVEGPDSDYYDQLRLLSAVDCRTDLPAKTLMDEVMAEAREFAEEKQFSDDVCMVAIEVERL